MAASRTERTVVTERRRGAPVVITIALASTTWWAAPGAAAPPPAPTRDGATSLVTPRPTTTTKDDGAAKRRAEPRRDSVAIPGTALSIDLVEVPMEGGARLWFGRTEVPWEVLDVFVHGLDQGANATGASTGQAPAAEAITRPSKPYISMDRGFGHHGYPAISVSCHNAVEFCRWLSATTGRRFRLPTVAERKHACALGAIDDERLTAHAWLAENAERRTHPVASLAPDAAGLFDMRGNASEWATATDGTFVAMGGSYRDAGATSDCTLAAPNDKAWNSSDPQIPKSRWWLADGGFVGFRVVCEGVEQEVEAAGRSDAPADRPARESNSGDEAAPAAPSGTAESRRGARKEQP